MPIAVHSGLGEGAVANRRGDRADAIYRLAPTA
jgi:hypothetical protein